MDIALYEPDIAQNTGTIMRLAACMGCAMHVIEPCGFPFSTKALRRSAMDYADHVTIHHHMDFDSFKKWVDNHNKRLILLTTKGATPHHSQNYDPNDILLLGRESAGVPENVHAVADARVVIPMQKGMRSLNVAISAAMVLGEAMRQNNLFADENKG